MQQILQYLVVFALQSAAIYAIAASGLVLTYSTSGVFNFAHGAIGMIVAFSFWQMTSVSGWGWPMIPSLLIALGVIAPGVGWLLDRLVMKRLVGASALTGIVATIGVLFALVQVAGYLWPQDEIRSLPGFFEGRSFEVFDVNVTYHRFLTLVLAAIVAFGLRTFLFNTRLGTAMRASVDSRSLVALNGVNPDRLSSLAWMLGCALAGLAGILIAPNLSQFSAIGLTLLVVQAYAAAMVGKLRSLPLTFLGAAILAETEQLLSLGSVRNWAGSWSPNLSTLSTAVPVLMLLIVLIVWHDERAGIGEKFGWRSPTPSIATVSKVMAAVVVACGLISVFGLFSVTTRLALGSGLALGIVMLSLVLLTGWAGQVSLTQLAFGGLAAVAVWKLGPVVGLIVGVLGVAVVGALVALPALKMRSLYLALTTMAFAMLLETIVYGSNSIFPALRPFAAGSASVRRFPGLEGDKVFLVVLAVAFAVVAVALTYLRNGPYGRQLAALKDSPAACITLGMDLTRIRLAVFALSAGIAGFGGAMLAMWNEASVSTAQYSLLEGGALGGLPLILVAVIGGITSVFGALFGASLLVGMPLLGNKVPILRNVLNIVPGLAGIGLAKAPDGAVSQIGAATRDVMAALERRREAGETTDEGPTAAGSMAVTAFATASASALGLTSRARPAPEVLIGSESLDQESLDYLDEVLGLNWGLPRSSLESEGTR